MNSHFDHDAFLYFLRFRNKKRSPNLSNCYTSVMMLEKTGFPDEPRRGRGVIKRKTKGLEKTPISPNI